MNDNLTYIVAVLDESSSMGVCDEATRAGFNAMLDEQAKVPGEAKLTLYKFSSNVPPPVFVDVDLKEVPRLNASNYRPNGMTALLDAIGTAIDQTGKRLEAMPESERPGKVVVLIQTDGDENASSQYNYEKIRAMIEHQQSKYSWGFTFLGANIDAISAGAKIGIGMASSIQYNQDASLNAFQSVSNYMTVSRSLGTQNATYSSTDRARAVTSDSK